MVSKIIDQLIVLIVYWLFALMYVDVVSVDYTFGGFYYEVSNLQSVATLCMVIYAYFLPKNKNSIIYVYSVLSLYFILLPAAVLMLYGGQSIINFLVIYFGVGMVQVFYKLFGRGKVRLGVNSVNINLYWYVFLMYVVLLFSAYIANFNFNLDFSKVYDYRFEFNDSIGFPMNYILPFVGGPLASFLAVYFYGHKKKACLIFVLAASLSLYGFTSNKSFIFGPIFSVILYIFLLSKHDLTKMLGLLMIALSLITLFSDGWLAAIFRGLFANRVVFLPVGISYAYIKEFGDLGYMYWAESKVGLGLFQSPLANNSVNYMAEIMVGNNNISANVGWLANGYMNLGVYGVLIYSVIISYVISKFDVWSEYFGASTLTASFGQSLLILITSFDLFTWLLTGGILALIVVLKTTIFISKISGLATQKEISLI